MNYYVDRYNNPYSEYGCSMCLIQKSNFKCVVGVTSLHMQIDEGINISNDDGGDEVVFNARSATIEIKNNEYAEQQTKEEMMRNAGDLVAKILFEGNLLQNVIIYGLALNYNIGLVKILKLIIDLIKTNPIHTVPQIVSGYSSWLKLVTELYKC